MLLAELAHRLPVSPFVCLCGRDDRVSACTCCTVYFFTNLLCPRPMYRCHSLTGSVFCSVVDPTAFLVGASCPVYALLSAHLANILLNHDALSEFGLSKFFLRITLVFLLSSIDFGFALFDRVSEPDGLILAFLGPFVGVAFGVSVGCVVVRSYERKLREQLACWLVIIFYVLAICGAIVYNVLNFDAFRQASAALF